MSKHPKTLRRHHAKPVPEQGPRFGRAIVIILLVSGLVLAALWWFAGKASRTKDPENLGQALPSVPGSTGESASAESVVTEFQRLTGRWQRSDAEYIIDIRGVDASGKLDASYLNPRPIHVAKAQATSDAGVFKVYVELQDVNYPGSKYSLAYLPSSDRLVGTYFQAVEGRSFDVDFVRMNSIRVQ